MPVIRGKEGADPAGLAFDALERARAEGADLLMIDTAGRLQNKHALMDELRKILRVLKKLDPEAPHDIVLVLDATTGQNAHNQVEVFKELVDLTGLIVTKLDGTAKGGVVVALARRFGLPIHAIGVGEAIDDLRPSRPRRSRAPSRARMAARAAEKGWTACPATLSRRCWAPRARRGAWVSGLGLRPQRRRRPRRLHAARQVRPGRRAGAGGDVRISGIKVGQVLGQELDPRPSAPRSRSASATASSCRRTARPRSSAAGCSAASTCRSCPAATTRCWTTASEITLTQSSVNLEDLIGRYIFSGQRGGRAAGADAPQ